MRAGLRAVLRQERTVHQLVITWEKEMIEILLLNVALSNVTAGETTATNHGEAGSDLVESATLTLTPVAYQRPQEPTNRPAPPQPHADDPWGLRDGRFGPRMGDWELTLGGGGITPHNFSSSTYNLNFTLGHYLTDHLEISFRQSIGFTDVGPSNFRGSSRGAIDWHFGDGRLRPFVGANFGGIYGDGGDTWLAGPEAGLKWFVHPQTFVFAMAEYLVFFDRVRDIDDNARRGEFVFTVGIGFLF